MMSDRYLTLDQLSSKLGNRSRSSIYRDIEAKRIPQPIKLGVRLYWRESDIDKLMDDMSRVAS